MNKSNKRYCGLNFLQLNQVLQYTHNKIDLNGLMVAFVVFSSLISKFGEDTA